MLKRKPAPGGNREAGYVQGVGRPDHSSNSNYGKADYARPIGEIIAVVMLKLALRLENEGRP